MNLEALQKVVSDSIKYPTFYTNTISMAETIGHHLNLKGFASVNALQNVLLAHSVIGNKEQDAKKLAESIRLAIFG